MGLHQRLRGAGQDRVDRARADAAAEQLFAEVTAAVLEKTDGLAQLILVALLRAACAGVVQFSRCYRLRLPLRESLQGQRVW
jgi:hypothetical protein